MTVECGRDPRAGAVHRRRVGRAPAGARRSTTSTRTRATSSRACRPERARTPGARSRRRRRPSPGWSQTPPAERQRDLPEGGRHPRERAEEVGAWLTRETGWTFGFAMFQLHFVPGLFRQAAGARVRADRRDHPVRHGAFAMGLRRPVGVVGAIAPWNAALILSARAIAAPLALGNTVVLKPSELSPYSGGLLWGEIFGEAGLPAGVAEHRHARARRGGADRRRARRAPEVRRSTSPARPRPAARSRRPRAEPQAGRARARRPQPADRARRRRPRLRGRRVRVRRVPPPGPDLHVGAADHRRAADRGRRSRRGSRRRPTGSRPATRRSTTRSSGRSSTAARSRPWRARRRRGREGREACSPAARRSARSTARRCSRTCPRTPSSPRARRSARSRRSRSSTAPTRRSSARTRRRTGSRRGSSRATPTGASRSRSGSRPGIVHVNDQPVGDEPQMPFGGVKGSGLGRFGGTAAINEFTEVHWVTVQSGRTRSRSS